MNFKMGWSVKLVAIGFLVAGTHSFAHAGGNAEDCSVDSTSSACNAPGADVGTWIGDDSNGGLVTDSNPTPSTTPTVNPEPQPEPEPLPYTPSNNVLAGIMTCDKDGNNCSYGREINPVMFCDLGIAELCPPSNSPPPSATLPARPIPSPIVNGECVGSPELCEVYKRGGPIDCHATPELCR